MSGVRLGAGWGRDVLGGGFESLTIPLAPDEPELSDAAATLVRAPRPSAWQSIFGSASGIDVLYVHGWSDYFFQEHVAQYWRQRGARFFALDLRRYGRNLSSEPLSQQLAGYVRSLDIYDEEIDAALTVIGHGKSQSSRRKLILMGHSTGGLVLSLWASRNQGRASALILNSPWLELQTREIGRLALSPVLDTLSKYRQKKPFPASEPGFYMRSISDQQEGEWAINTAWHPNRSFPVFPGWLDAIIRGHQQVARGLGLQIPVLVLLSDKSLLQPTWDERMKRCDVVLDVVGVAQRSLNLGSYATIVRLEGALHDVFLSEAAVREQGFNAVDQWLTGAAQTIRKASHATTATAHH
jgi:alpha-beta hydrolase superfamily lysophospholipase